MRRGKERSILQNHQASCYSRLPEPLRTAQEDGEPSRSKPYLLFDAGGALVFPDEDFLIRAALAYGVKLTHEQLFSGYYRLIYHFDCQARVRGRLRHLSWPQGYVLDLFEMLGISDASTQAIARAADARSKKKSLWTFTFDWVRETLSRLAAQGYCMSIISNSDGRTLEVFRDLGLTCYFDDIFDSKNLGVKKPAPAIFEHVLQVLSLGPADALYIGDVYEVDVVGANRAGVGAVHLDPLGLYADWPGVHLRSVAELPTWLEQYTAARWDFDLLPAREPGPRPASAVETRAPSVRTRVSASIPTPANYGDGS